MFYCIGENKRVACDVGKGDTVKDALFSWASELEWSEIIQEFTAFKPTLIEGKDITIELVIPPPIIRIKECFE